MGIINLINAICLSKNRIDAMDRWKILSIHKENKKLNNLISEFLNLDIFDASNNIISFLLSLDKEAISCLHYVRFDENFVSIDIDAINFFDDYSTNALVCFYPKSNRFEINADNVAYTIYRNTKNGNTITKLWEPLSIDLKEIYVDIILQMAEYISESHI